MDPLSIIAGAIGIFDGLKELYRFSEDVLKAPEERKEFKDRLSCVDDMRKIISECLAQEPDPASSRLVEKLDVVKNPTSPLVGLKDVVDKMQKVLECKEKGYRKWVDFKWHSEKKKLDAYFSAIDGYCNRVTMVLASANVEISRLSRETNGLIKKMWAEQQVHFGIEIRMREETDRRAIEKWLSTLENQARQREIFASRKGNTGEWFLEREEFEIFEKGDLNVLRCHGKVGTGKTVLSSIVADHLRKKTDPLRTPVLCLYIERSHSPRDLLGSLVKQLVQNKSSGVSTEVKEAWKEAVRVNARPSEAVLKNLFLSEAEWHDWIYIVIDALDEASEESRDFVEKRLRKYFPKSSSKVRLLTIARLDEDPPPSHIICDICHKERLKVYYHCASCRQYRHFDLCPGCKGNGEVCTANSDHIFTLPDFIETEVIVPFPDFKRYVEASIRNQFPEKDADPEMETEERTATQLGIACEKDESFFNDIVRAIIQNSDCKFLLAQLILKSISYKENRKVIMKALKELRLETYALNDRIDVVYDTDLNARIRKQDPEKAKRAIKLFSIVYFAKRNMTAEELTQIWCAECAEPDESDYDEYGMLPEQEILNCTGGYISIGRVDGIVRLDHDRTLREYFDKKKDVWFPEGESYIAKLCLRYLDFKTFAKRCPDEELGAREAKHPFFAYAVNFWGDHVRDAGKDPEVSAMALKYVRDKPRIEAYIQGAWETNTRYHDKWDVRRDIDALHVCAWFDLAEVMSKLDTHGKGVDIPEKTYGQTPLMYAARRGNINIAKRLLELGADVNARSTKGRNALHEAVVREKNAMVQYLVNSARNIDLNIRNPVDFDRTALMVAIRQKSPEIAKILLQNPQVSLDVNLQALDGNTALAYAALRNQGEIIDVLLASGANPALAEKGSGRSAMMIAAEKNHFDIVSRLLAHGVNPDLTIDIRGQTPALGAAGSGSFEALRVLVDGNADLSCVDEDGRTLVHSAAEFGNVEILQLLKDRGLRLDSPSSHGMTPLYYACRGGQYSKAKFLIDNGANCLGKDDFNRTPYMVARQYGREDIMELLLGRLNHTELETAHDSQVEELPTWSPVVLERLSFVTSRDTNGLDLSITEPITKWTALHWAVKECNDDYDDTRPQALALQELLNIDTKYLNTPNRDKQTPLHLAVRYECPDCTETLLKYEPELEELDRYGSTALEMACNQESFAIAISLVEAGASVLKVRNKMQRLLFAAIHLHSARAVQVLLMAGADRLAQDEYGRTADMLAKQVDNGDGIILKILRSNRSFMFDAMPPKTATSTVSEMDGAGDDESEVAEVMVYRPAFPSPAGLTG